jgi:alanine racemase
MPSLSRRQFLAVTVAAGAAGAWARSAGASNQPQAGSTSLDPWIEVNAANLAYNVSQVAKRAGGRPILAVVKNNAYGMGLAQAAKLLEPLAPIHGLAVVKLQEAVTLRDAGVKKPVLLMGPVGESNLDEVVARGISPMVYTDIGRALDRVSTARQRAIGLHICVDTGIGRVGVPHTRASALIRDLAARKSARLEGIMMTFAEDPALDLEQMLRFETLCAELLMSKIALGRKHAASSFGLFQHPASFYDMVRPGMALYGVYSEQDFRKAKVLDLRPALALRAPVAYVKQLRAGESAGYSRAYVAKDDVWIATLPVGHADGWPRAAAKGARVRIGTDRYPVIASVSASHTIVEIGREARVKIGDVATMWGWQDGSRPEDVSAECGASVYDLTMHLNPTLPRVVTST